MLKTERPSLGQPQTRLLALAALVTAAATLLLTVQAANAQTKVTVEVPDSMHHLDQFEARFTGIEPLEPFVLRDCYGDQTRDECGGGFAVYRIGENQETFPWTAKRLLVNDNGEVVDCAVAPEPCWLEIVVDDAVVRTQLTYSSERPLPELYINPSSVVAGETVTVSTNQYLGSDVDEFRGRESIYQCTTRDIPSFEGCVSLDSFFDYGTTVAVTPRRTMVSDRKLIDCAAVARSCELVLGFAQVTGTPLVFELAPPLAEQSVELAKTDYLANFESVKLTVRSSLRTRFKVEQCAKKATARRAVCNVLSDTSIAGDASGELATRRLTVRPHRYLFTKKNRTRDCNNEKLRCFIRVVAEGSRHRIGDQLPISFDRDEKVVIPHMVAPNGPFVDGQKVSLEVHGLARGMRIGVRCFAPSQFCSTRRFATANSDGVAKAVITMKERDVCEQAGECRIRVNTRPKTATFTQVVVFE